MNLACPFCGSLHWQLDPMDGRWCQDCGKVSWDTSLTRLLAKMGENPEPKAVCPKCWFELRTTEEIEAHVCPPSP